MDLTIQNISTKLEYCHLSDLVMQITQLNLLVQSYQHEH